MFISVLNNTPQAKFRGQTYHLSMTASHKPYSLTVQLGDDDKTGCFFVFD